ncbi:transposase [Photorhabdus temperata]|uniref:transposase n=1 Tax=Photorhabdus temperata TaxID=574560 RepID=UPI000389F5AD|nr:transposase [Photorhabdus temperata]EQB99871.1 transposase [Photorhabdus temperata subsp. temperata M1021]
MYDAYQVQIQECDTEIEAVLVKLSAGVEKPTEPIPQPKYRTKQPNQLNFDVRTALYHLVGADLTQIHGLGPYLALRMISECGTDMTKWSTAKHFTSWLTLCPGSKISGGKKLLSHSCKSNNRIVAHLRLAATTVGRSSTAFARKITVLFYNAMRYGMQYQDPGKSNMKKRIVTV